MKKGIAVLLAALMLAGVWLVGCGERNPDELWAAAKENIVTTKSARLHMTMDMAFDLQGETTSMTMKMDEACTQDPLSAEVNMTMDMGGLGKMDTTMYLVQEDGEYVNYMKMSGGILGDEDVGWSRSTIDMTDLAQYNAMDSAKLYLDVLNSFQSAGKEAIGSYNTIRYDGKVTGQDISKMLDTLGTTCPPCSPLRTPAPWPICSATWTASPCPCGSTRRPPCRCGVKWTCPAWSTN